jgi:hypothetical protein
MTQKSGDVSHLANQFLIAMPGMVDDNFAGAVDTLARTLGGFGFVPGARDAAILVSLPAGGYTVQVSGLNNGTGEAIIEVYEVP